MRGPTGALGVTPGTPGHGGNPGHQAGGYLSGVGKYTGGVEGTLVG